MLLRGRVQTAAAFSATRLKSSSRMAPLSTDTCPRLDPSSSWPAIAGTYTQAQSSGAATKTETKCKLLADEQTGISFVIREASALSKKPPGPQPSQPPQQAICRVHEGEVP
ncbi:hypothetical protein DUNSADRAFT_10471 [Dunaliella salina]|uniref:Encoded protein n=1 Tax=Dunaliella salina TaxID=3046 RepID=A0ABQ7GF89_DUNSA|nr:hypothetical protein DUNSADRAFT_10471 [Dunaliella salina]|eukprot:KAF5833271.1 hypothetical protein DUNSADRAFT_10471 [Dunaliella salina]